MKREYFWDLEQGTDEWLSVRAGRVTASEFHTTMMKGRGGKDSKTKRKYLLQLAGERITGEVAESYSNSHMDRGKVLEEEARSFYCMQEGVDIEQVGFISMGDDLGYSPDGVIGESGLFETKSRLPHILLELLLGGEIPVKDYAQCQGGLWVAERDWIDYMAYWPKMKPFIKRIYRDDLFLADTETAIKRFLEELHQTIEKYKNA